MFDGRFKSSKITPTHLLKTADFADYTDFSLLPFASLHLCVKLFKECEMSRETIQETVSNYFAAIRSMDAEAFVAVFAVDGVSHDPVGAPPFSGHEGLRKFFGGMQATFTELNMRETAVYINKNEAAVHWQAEGVGKNGRSATFSGINSVHPQRRRPDHQPARLLGCSRHDGSIERLAGRFFATDLRRFAIQNSLFTIHNENGRFPKNLWGNGRIIPISCLSVPDQICCWLNGRLPH